MKYGLRAGVQGTPEEQAEGLQYKPRIHWK